LVECDVWGTAWRDRRVRARNGKPTHDSSSPGRSSVRRSRGVAGTKQWRLKHVATRIIACWTVRN